MRAFTLVIWICIAGASVLGQENSDAAKQKNPVPATAESIAAGKKLFAKCASCHGANGQGGAGGA